MRRFGLLSVVVFIALLAEVSACVTPVYRYALERWESDVYRVVVFHRGELDETHLKSLAPVAKISRRIYGKPANAPEDWTGEENLKANLTLRFANLDEDVSSATLALLSAQNKNMALPHAVIRYPRATGIAYPLWSGPLGNLDPSVLVDSPKRREVGRLLIDGETAVWVLLLTGDAEKDKTAHETLERELVGVRLRLKLPVIEDVEPLGVDFLKAREQWRITFPIVEVSRADREEVPFITMLIKTDENALKRLNEPIAFPIFGQGRVLRSFVGEQINGKEIEESCSFLVGSCECEVKDQNPGKDMLMLADWSKVHKTVKDVPLPPLTGYSDFVDATMTTTTLTAPKAEGAGR
jgi:hypothetical protein